MKAELKNLQQLTENKIKVEKMNNGITSVYSTNEPLAMCLEVQFGSSPVAALGVVSTRK